MPAYCKHTYLKVVSGPVYAAYGRANAAQAALVHVTGYGTAQSREIEKSITQ